MDAVRKGSAAPDGKTTGIERTLLLLRHAKSSWQDAKLRDFDRPLNPRGIKACQFMAGLFSEKAINPDIILCSPAARTRETLHRIAEQTPLSAKPIFEDRLYGADAKGLIAELQKTEHAKSILLVGHNPAIHDLALLLCRRGRAEAMDRLERKYPTAALAEIRLPGPYWHNLHPNDGVLVDFIQPRRPKTAR